VAAVSTVEAERAFRTCERITRSRARNFYFGIRLLPQDKRMALCAVYAMSRRIDDIGDGPGSPADRLAELDEVRSSLPEAHPGADDPLLSALGYARRRFELPMDAFEDLLDGVEMDVAGAVYGRFEDLEVYCRRVAGSIGRLSTAIFGPSRPERASALADELGVAMQLTNILRDVGEDLSMGRVYLPRADLERFGCAPEPLHAARADVDRLIRWEAGRAREWFARGLRVLPLLDARSAACVSAMAGIYRRILDRIELHPTAILERRVGLPAWEKAWVAVRSLAGPRSSVGVGG
jgi:phytoene synthase